MDLKKAEFIIKPISDPVSDVKPDIVGLNIWLGERFGGIERTEEAIGKGRYLLTSADFLVQEDGGFKGRVAEQLAIPQGADAVSILASAALSFGFSIDTESVVFL